MSLETMTVQELIRELEKYPVDAQVYYSTRYALTPFSVRMVEGYVIIEMSKETKEMLNNDY